MKRIILFLLLSVPLIANGQTISEQRALEYAQQFVQKKQLVQNKKLYRALMSKNEKYDTTEKEPAYYIFNAEADGGFVIVAGQEREENILGYSDSGRIDVDNMPENLQAWLGEYEKAIASDGVSTKCRSSVQQHAAIDYLIKTKWDQGNPFYLQCPIKDGEHCLTGCVPTALAQMMYYYRYPTRTTKTIPAYTTSSGMTVEALSPTTFDYNKMLLTYYNNYSDESANAVAKLMRYCGQAVQAGYGLYGTGAIVETNELHEYFGYNINARYIDRCLLSNSQWDNMIYQEIAKGDPVLIAASGHQFICDGYDGKGYYHFNWGWGGKDNGYFLMDECNDYTSEQKVVIGFYPDRGEPVKPYLLTMGNPSCDNSDFYRTNNNNNFSGIVLNGYVANGFVQFSGECGWGLYRNGELVKILKSTSKTFAEDTWYSNYAEVEFGAGLSNGRYVIRMVYRVNGNSEWESCLLRPGHGIIRNVFLSVDIDNNHMKISKGGGTDVSDVTIHSVEIEGKKRVNHLLDIKMNLTNNSNEPLNFLLWENSNSNYTTIANCYLEYGETGDVILKYTPKSAGSKTLKISTDYNGNVVVYTTTINVDNPQEEQSLTASSQVDGMVVSQGNNILPRTTFNATLHVKNTGNYSYDDAIRVQMIRMDFISNNSYMQSEIYCKDIGIVLQPNQEKNLNVHIERLIPGEEYYVFIQYYSKGKLVRLYNAEIQFKVTEPEDLIINSTNFPDAVFREYISGATIDKDQNGKLSEEEIAAVTTIDVNNLQISNLQGIEFFTALTTLSCRFTKLKSIDLSKNTALVDLDCRNNSFTTLDVSKNTELVNLKCARNWITSLDVSNNTKLNMLRCNYNRLTSLDVSKCTKLQRFDCYGNKIGKTAMGNLVASLPSGTNGRFYVIDTTLGTEENVCTTDHVAAAKAKGWTVYDYHDGNSVEYTGSSETVPGDLSGDGELNGTDLVMLTNLILNGQMNTVADLNGDGQVNGTDYVLMVNRILGITSAPMMLAPAMETATEANLSIEDFTIEAGETKEMIIDLTNYDDQMTLVQFDLRLPEGLSIVTDGIEIAGRTTWQEHLLYAHDIGNVTRVMLASARNAEISGNSGALISIRLTASDTFDGGDIVIGNSLLVTPCANESQPTDYTYHINSTTGIRSLTPTLSQGAETYYDLSGRPVTNPGKGIYIVNGKKIIIK